MIDWESFSKGVGAVGTVFAALVATKKWVLDHYEDGPVLDVLRGRENVARAMSALTVPEPTTVTLIAKQLKRSPKRVQKSLLRLESNDKVHREWGGWRFGPIPLASNAAGVERWKKWE